MIAEAQENRPAGIRQWRLFLLVTVLAVAVTVAVAGNDQPPIVTLDSETLNRGIGLRDGWRYQGGDDPACSAPGFDDRDWPVASSFFLRPEELPGDWSGSGWFRRRVRVGAREVLELAVHAAHGGASEVYADGRLVARFGTVGQSPEEEHPVYPRHFASFSLTPGEHLLAVRYSNWMGYEVGNSVLQPPRGFTLTLAATDRLTASHILGTRRNTAVHFTTCGMFAALALVHLLLSVLRPRSRDHLLFAVFAGAVAADLMVGYGTRAASSIDTIQLYGNVASSLTVLWALAGIRLELRIVGKRPGALFWLLALGGAVAAAVRWSAPALREPLLLRVFLALATLEMLRLAVVAVRQRLPDAWVVGAGLGLLTLGVGSDVVDDLFALRLINTELPHYAGLVAGALALSLYLSRAFARTNRELQARLEEVHRLTRRAVEQERRSARQEAERLVLAADNRRKTQELERARELQLAMLPDEHPDHPLADVACRMQTATEVGGDYYDFAAGEHLSLVVGDAAGHGLHAGMVVAVARSLFRTGGPEDPLITVIERIRTGVESFHQPMAAIAVFLLRLEPGRCRFVSAGMPPLWLWRQATGEVEEILVPAVPLGTLAQAEYRESDFSVAPGDTLLLTTDGLAENRDPAGEAFGYDRVRDCFADLAGSDAASIVEGLLAVAESHLAGAAPEDDITVVALRIRDAARGPDAAGTTKESRLIPTS